MFTTQLTRIGEILNINYARGRTCHRKCDSLETRTEGDRGGRGCIIRNHSSGIHDKQRESVSLSNYIIKTLSVTGLNVEMVFDYDRIQNGKFAHFPY